MAEVRELLDEEVCGRSEEAGGFCWIRAMKPGMLSFADELGCT